ncbi:MAG: hypothetical protein AAGA54_13000 [Myxococcota bacterium]
MKRFAAALLLLSACGDDVASLETDGGTDGDGSSTDASGPSTTAATTATTQGSDTDATDCGPIEITCGDPVSVACEGPETAVALDEPALSCDAWTLQSDAPTAYPVGDTQVTFTADDGAETASCSVTVSVVDEDAPTLACPEPGTLVRPSADAFLTAPAIDATDVCDEAPSVTATPAMFDATTTVTYEASDASGNTATCDVGFDVVDAFAVPGFRIISAEGDLSQTQVTLAWEPPESAAITGLRVEVSDAADGPWTSVADLEPNEQLHAYTLDADAGFVRVVSVTAFGDGGATDPRATYRIGADQYDVRDVDVPNVPFDTTLYGVVRYPADLDGGPYPLVVALHGNHGNCRPNINSPNDYCITTQDHDCNDPSGVTTPNAEGYVYFLETLAAQGYIAVSISGNAMNCRDDFIFQRAELIGEHLRHWSAWNGADQGETSASFVGAVDLDRVGLVGHSRGGDAASNVPGVLASAPIPGVNVRSVFAVAPTDFHNVEVPGTDLAVLLPGCDRDVAPLSGMNHYDRSIDFDDGARRSQVFLLGANHNFFNTQWQISEWDLFGNPNDPFCTPPDDPQKLAQTHTLEALLGSWFERTLAATDEPEDFMQATAPSPTSFDLWAEQDLQMRWSYSGDSRVLVDDFAGPGAPLQNALGGQNAYEDWFLFEACFEQDCDPFFNHVRNVARLLWQLPAEPMATFSLQGYDASEHVALTMRVVSRRSLLNQGLDENDFFVRLRDGDGRVAELLLSDAKPLEHLYPHSDPLEVLETFNLPLAWFVEQEPMLDLANLASLEFDMTATGDDGSVIVSEIEFAG